MNRLKKGIIIPLAALPLVVGALSFTYHKKDVVEVNAAMSNYGYDEGEYVYYTGNYYTNSNITDSDLNTGTTTLLPKLCSLIQPTQDFGYGNLWSLYHTSDVYPSNYDGTDPLTKTAYPTTGTQSSYRGKIWDMYGNTKYTAGGSAQGASYNSVGDAYNREHTVPQSWFGKKTPAVSDPHHIFATDGYVNNQRSDHPYGEVNGTPQKCGTDAFGGIGSPVAAYGSCGEGTVFEPEDAYKGDFARAVLYMGAAYYDWNTSMAQGSNGCFTRSGNYNLISQYYIKLLTKWSAEDPVSQKEIDRNNVIFNSSQHNRNPFIDHPNWAYKIWGGTEYTWGRSGGGSGGDTPKVNSVTVSPSTLSLDIKDGQKTGSLTATVSVTGDIAKTVTWSISPENHGVTVSSSGVVTAASNATTGTYTVTATSTADSDKSDSCTVTVSDSSTPTPTPTPGDSETITMSEQGFSNAQEVTKVTATDFSVTFDKGTNNNTPKYYDTGTAVRLYSGNTFTVSSTTKTIVGITFTYGSGDYANEITSNPSGFSSPTWSGSASSVTFTIGGSSNHRRIAAISVTYESTPSSDPELSSITLNTDNVKKTFNVGDEFTYSGLVATAHYTQGKADATVTPTSVSSPDMSTSGEKTVTVTYIEDEITKTASYTITVNAVPAGITASIKDNKVFHPGETITKDDIEVKDDLNNVITDFTFSYENKTSYSFKYSDAASGGAETNKTFTNSITYSTFTCSVTAKVQRVARQVISSVTDEITANDLAATDTSYIDFDGVEDKSDALYAGNSAKDSSGRIQLRSKNSDSGIVSTSSGGKITSVKITVGTGTNTINVYGKNTAYSSASDLYSTSSQGNLVGSLSSTGTINFTTSYEYVGIRSSSGAVYISKVEVTYGSEDTATNVANYIMYEDTNGQCNTKFSVAKGYFEGLSLSQRNVFMTSTDYVISTARTRFEAWAKALGKVITHIDGDYVISAPKLFTLSENNGLIVINIIVSSLAISLLGSYLIIRKKKNSKL